jgi:hypothetical protein
MFEERGNMNFSPDRSKYPALFCADTAKSRNIAKKRTECGAPKY